MIEKLKNCPFCDGKDLMPMEAHRNSQTRLYPIVRCMKCFCEVSGKNGDYSHSAKSAITAWNTRPAPDAANVGVDEETLARMLSDHEIADYGDKDKWWDYCKPRHMKLAKTVLEVLGKSLIANNKPAPEGMKWQPIETAPKDGFHILLWSDDIQFVGFWAQGRAGGWCAVADKCPSIKPNPTHWMPLPAPPSADAIKSAEGGER